MIVERSTLGDPPWWRDEDGKLVRRGYVARSSGLGYLGPFELGDQVMVNGAVTGVLELADEDGIVVVPVVTTRHAPGVWFPASGVVSIAPVVLVDPGRIPECLEEPHGRPDESLPMRPPPVIPLQDRGDFS